MFYFSNFGVVTQDFVVYVETGHAIQQTYRIHVQESLEYHHLITKYLNCIARRVLTLHFLLLLLNGHKYKSWSFQTVSILLLIIIKCASSCCEEVKRGGGRTRRRKGEREGKGREEGRIERKKSGERIVNLWIQFLLQFECFVR